MRRTDQPIPVTGLGCLCAAGGSVPEVTDTLFAGQPGRAAALRAGAAWREVRGQRYPVFQLDERAAPAGYYEGPECLRCGRLALAAAREALVHAGLTPETLRDRRVGVCLGTTVGSAMNNEAFYRDFRANRQPGIEPIRQYLRANPARMVAQEFGLTGPCQTITNACSSGAAAIGDAAGWLRTGICDVVIAGGADMLCNVIHAGFLSLLITDTGPCRPFDRNRRGLNLGEGAGIVVLESPRSAQERQAQVQAWLCGYGNASDAYHISTPEPKGTGLRRAIHQALTEAGVGPQEIDFINAHGTGTPENDRVEGRLFPEMFPGVPFGSTKGFTGHTLGAAGGIEAVITILCLQRKCLPANVGFQEPDPEFPGRPVTENTAVAGRYGLSDSVAFGGNNVALIFREAEEEKGSGTFCHHGPKGAPHKRYLTPFPHRLDIHGIGLVGGFGAGRHALLEALRHGGRPNGAVPVTGEGTGSFSALGKGACPPAPEKVPVPLPAYQVDIAGVSRFVSGAVARRMNRFAKLAVLGAALALEDAGWEKGSHRRNDAGGDPIPPRRNDIGLVLASGYGASKSTFDFLDSMIDGEGQFPSPTLFSNSVHSSAASHVSIVMELGGPCLTVSQFEMSPISALLTAQAWLLESRVEAVLFGAVDEICPVLGYCYDQFFGVRACGPIEPFAWDKQTAVMGEGAAFLLLTRGGERPTRYGYIAEATWTQSHSFVPPVDRLLVLGADGHTCYAHDYRRLAGLAARSTAYTPLYGSLPGGQAFDVAIAALATELESEQRTICSVKCDAQGNCGVIECCFGQPY